MVFSRQGGVATVLSRSRTCLYVPSLCAVAPCPDAKILISPGRWSEIGRPVKNRNRMSARVSGADATEVKAEAYRLSGEA